MAEELFTDLLKNFGKNLKKAKEEGKFQGGYRFTNNGKVKLGGGYYDEDKMFEVEIGKDGGNVLFKKRFADGGSTSEYEQPELTKKVIELMEDGYEFGEAVKEAMKQGYADGGITTAKRGFVDGPGSYSGTTAYENVKSLGIESKIKQLYLSEGLGAGNITTQLKLLFPGIAGKINSTLIGDYLKYANSNLNLIKPAIATTNQHGPIRTLEEVQKIVDELPKISKGEKSYRMNAKDLEGRSEYNHVDENKSANGKKGKTYVTRKELDKYQSKLKNLGPSKVIKKPNAKTDANIKRINLDKKGNANAGRETIELNNKLKVKNVTQQNNKLRQLLKSDPKAAIKFVRDRPNIINQLEATFSSKTGEFGVEKISNKKIKTIIKSGMFSFEHTSPMAAGAKNTNFSTNLSLMTNRANAKIMRPLNTWLNNLDNYKDFKDSRVVKAKEFLTNNNLRIKINNQGGKPIYIGADLSGLSAVERVGTQAKGLQLNSGLAAIEDGFKGTLSTVKDSLKSIGSDIKNIGKVDYSKMSLGTGKLAKVAGVAKNIAKVGGKALGVAAIPLTAYEINRMHKEGKTWQEMLGYPVFLDGMVGEAQDLLKMSPVERQSIMNQQIAEDESMLDSDFSQPSKNGLESVNNEMVRERVKKQREAEEAERRAKRTKKSSGFTFGNNYGISSFDQKVWNN